MIPRYRLAPQTNVGFFSGIGANQVFFQVMPDAGYALGAFLFQVTATITGTAPGTPRDLSAVIHDVQIINDQNVKVASVDGQTLTLTSLDAIKRFGQSLSWQAWLPTVTAATGVAAVGQYSIAGPFAGSVFKCYFNLNAATSTGYTGPSAASYTVTCTLFEVAYENIYTSTKSPLSGKVMTVSHTQPIRTYYVQGRYITNANYVSAINTKHTIVAVDNAELSTVVSSITAGGVRYSAQSCQSGEDAFAGTIPDGVPVSTAFAGNAAVPVKNVQTGNGLGIAEFVGTVSAPLNVALKSAQTMLIYERQSDFPE